ncbi:hypothetical protein HYPSUDRAFT_205982 [Hypholoma sublateritium FD-334 SS-4]|uniref:DUF7223 domain-containing protein n=1 Tax=Hypholoma sublateritium (strain FD-334 SS-4) TaxID=945553 RepID=A0A0D2KSJ9_HYPSF|nr:hypothetical protein HYPSUDRAFT_205982 [Hypholoma sublateritium FD-334 SS-4]
MFSSVLLLLPALVAPAFAANDWSKPCLSGVCEYDMPATNGAASGTLKIWGASSAITDITPAAGWQIIGCSSDALAQDIRLVCTDESSGRCKHLFRNNKKGAVGKLVRLPENCGKSAFAVVTSAHRAHNQTIPASVSASLSKRGISNTTVQGLSISTNFGASGVPSAGAINFAIRAANVPGASGSLVTSAQQLRRGNSRVYDRGIFDFVKNAIAALSSLTNFNVTQSTTLPPFDIDKSFNLVNQNISCPPIDGQVKVDVDAKAHAVASIGVAASGTIIPPVISSFAVITGLNANINGTLSLTADASGSIDTGRVQLFEVGVPGLDFPGILTIGPTFEIDGQATATLDANVGLTVGIAYSINNAQLVFPPNGNGTKGTFSIDDTPLQISASPNATATGTVEAHLIPSVNLGITALGGIVQATIFLDLDASASVTLSGQGEANSSATVGRRDNELAGLVRRGQNSPRRYFWTAPTDATSNSADARDASATVYSRATSNSTATNSTSVPVSASANGTFSGCFEIDGGLDVNAGATGSFFGIFNKSTQVELFSKEFQIFKKCFASSATTVKRSIVPRRSTLLRNTRAAKRTTPEKRAFTLQCSSVDSSALQSLIDTTVSASS